MDHSFLFSLGMDTIDNINGMLVDYRETTGYNGHVKFYNLNLKITWQNKYFEGQFTCFLVDSNG